MGKYKEKMTYVLLSIFLAISMLMSGCGDKLGGDTDKATSAWQQVSPTKDTSANIDKPQDVIKNTDTGEKSKATEPAKEPVQEKDATLVMVGDMLLHKAVSDSGKMSDGTYNYDHFFEHVKDDIKSADLAIVNEEVILGGIDLGISGYPTFNGVFEVGDAIDNAGFDVVLHATNHTLDKGKKGLENCINFWKKKHPDITVTGMHDSKEDQEKIRVCEVNGIKIAILNYTYGTNGIPLPSDMPYAVDLLDKDRIQKDVKKAKKLADFVVACPHWGIEYNIGKCDDQDYWTEIFSEAGVDLVIGTHPHVIEPVEWVKNSKGHKMLVYYSLGNFINSTSSSEKNVGYRYIGAMAKVSVHMDGEGKVSISDYGVEPLVTQNENGEKGITTYKLKDYTDELASKNKVKYKQSDFSVEYCKNLCREVFGDLYKD